MGHVGTTGTFCSRLHHIMWQTKRETHTKRKECEGLNANMRLMLPDIIVQKNQKQINLPSAVSKGALGSTDIFCSLL